MACPYLFFISDAGNKYTGMDGRDLKRLKELEEENRKLKQDTI